jgi:hypothetical protein
VGRRAPFTGVFRSCRTGRTAARVPVRLRFEAVPVRQHHPERAITAIAGIGARMTFRNTAAAGSARRSGADAAYVRQAGIALVAAFTVSIIYGVIVEVAGWIS